MSYSVLANTGLNVHRPATGSSFDICSCTMGDSGVALVKELR